MMHAARILAGFSQVELAKASGIRRQTISRMENTGAEPIVSRDSTTVAVLAALGRHGLMMQQRGVALAQSAGNANRSPVQNKTPAGAAAAGAGG
jgi:transcriptional regulator with XRE-family HTH domain